MSAENAEPLVRRARPEDADVLALLDSLVNPSPWTAAQFRGACAGEGSPEVGLVVEDTGQVVGFLVYSRVLDEGSILNMAVHPRLQRRGRGAALLSVALERLRAEGGRRCQLEVRASNAAAHALYQALGFTLDGVRRNYYPLAKGREDALLMSRPL